MPATLQRIAPACACAPRLRSTKCSAHWRNSSQIRANKCIHQHNCSTWNNFAVAMRSRCLDGRSDNCSTWNNFSRCAAPFARSGPPGGKSQIVPRGTIVLPDTGVGCALQKIARKYATRRARIEQQNQKPRHEGNPRTGAWCSANTQTQLRIPGSVAA